ncbi:Acyl-CoA-binding domain-containing protein 4 [Capsicum baccatum]|uniref:Acyl-CoA-binding domain-containing protein 4 n=1 Tax=Capsicum baccatum TaxID=33114 RepID=A0A2G2W7W9_CAPBA|nr:Acyl-CoA-binding domain-containing protein 4 [Capsicum baccatum]
MASTEAMRLFVKILETVMIPEPVTENGNVLPEIKTIPAENGNLSEPQDKDVVSEGVGAVGGYDQWVSPPISGPRPKARDEHRTAVIDDKMYIFGGNHNGRYLSDLQVGLDLRSWTRSNVEVKTSGEASQVPAASFTGHSVIPWQGNKLISIGGHVSPPSETMQVRVFDLQTLTWSNLKTYGKPPLSRGGHSVTPAGTSLAIFGGQDANRSLLNDLHILDLETMTWNEMDTF